MTQYYQLTTSQCIRFRGLSVQHQILKDVNKLKNKNNKTPVSISDSLAKLSGDAEILQSFLLHEEPVSSLTKQRSRYSP